MNLFINFLSAFPKIGNIGKQFLKKVIVISILLGYSISTLAVNKNKKPNLIVILTDDQGYSDVGCYGAIGFKTPHIDKMAEEGVRFTDFYAGAFCSPSRASLMTGCYSKRLGINDPINNPTDGLNPNEITLAEHLKNEGYATALIGKWHLGLPDNMSPIAQGFDYFSGIPLSQIRHGYTDHTDGENAYYKRQWKTIGVNMETWVEYNPNDTLFTQRITKESLDFIKSNKDNPFFLYISHAQVHREVLASKEFQEKSDYNVYGDAIEELDWSVGQILKSLKKFRIDKNTLVIFLSDNGPAPGERGSARPLRGRKGQTWEGGIRVPCIMRWPEKIPKGIECNKIASIMDIFPTFSNIIGTKMPNDRIIDGKNIWYYMTNQEQLREIHSSYFYYNPQGYLYGVRKEEWKLHYEGMEVGWALYNLNDDIGETSDVSKEFPEKVVQLQKLLDLARNDMGDGPDHEGKNIRPIGRFIKQ